MSLICSDQQAAVSGSNEKEKLEIRNKLSARILKARLRKKMVCLIHSPMIISRVNYKNGEVVRMSLITRTETRHCYEYNRS